MSQNPDIPEPMRQRTHHKLQLQEVVKVDLVPERGRRASESLQAEPVMEIICGQTVIRLTNAVDPGLLRTLLAGLGGAL